MNQSHPTPYGNWPSPLSAESLVEGARGLGSLQVDGGYLYWSESRPGEGGRSTIMRWKEGGEPEQLLGEPFNARTRVHEYGGVSFVVSEGTIWFSNFSDQRLYRVLPGEAPEAMTPEADVRYAACQADQQRHRLICVREDHRENGEARNELVALSMAGNESVGEVLFSGTDFVSAPVISDDGQRIAFVTWNHPNMPWDETQLWSAGFAADGSLSSLTMHNPGIAEAVIQPAWGPDGSLYVLSDRENWWTIYRVNEDNFVRVEHGGVDVEIGGPMWGLGGSAYRVVDEGQILAEINDRGVSTLAMIDLQGGGTQRLELPSAAIGGTVMFGAEIASVCYYFDRPAELIIMDQWGRVRQSVRTSSDHSLGSVWVPDYQLISFPTATGTAVAHGIYLPPTNPDVTVPEDSAPPLIVMVHGGPTSMASPAYNSGHLYWTSRGFAILELNYRGSTGFGREYRRALYGEWGVADVEDAVAGATWLAEKGLADPQRLIIRGGSAGGYTTLAAHAFHDAFAAGTSRYGISDLEALARDTHKFESRYLDQMIGPYPERRDLYEQRSPIHHLDGFSAPLLLLQGMVDPVVPPNQSEMIYEALKAKGIPTAFIGFEGEAHGFRKAENIVRSLEAELYFYSKVLGFEISDQIPPIAIDNLPQISGSK